MSSSPLIRASIPYHISLDTWVSMGGSEHFLCLFCLSLPSDVDKGMIEGGEERRGERIEGEGVREEIREDSIPCPTSLDTWDSVRESERLLYGLSLYLGVDEV